jgi:hypothetical protein
VAYKLDDVRNKWQALDREKRRKAEDARRALGLDPYGDELAYTYVREVWADPDYVIVENDSAGDGTCYKVPFSADESGEISFGSPVEVKQEYVELSGIRVWADDSDAVNNLIELAGGRVKSYFKKSKSGKSVQVGGYDRSGGGAMGKVRNAVFGKPLSQRKADAASAFDAATAHFKAANEVPSTPDPTEPKTSHLSMAEQLLLKRLSNKGAKNLTAAEAETMRKLLLKRKGQSNG